MTLKSGALTMATGTIKALSLILAEGVADSEVYAVDLQADASNSNPLYVGASDVTSSTGVRVPTPSLSTPEAPYRLGDFKDKAIRLGDIYVTGTTGDKVHILVFA